MGVVFFLDIPTDHGAILRAFDAEVAAASQPRGAWRRDRQPSEPLARKGRGAAETERSGARSVIRRLRHLLARVRVI